MNWSSRYVGVPEAGCHCWELVRRVYAEELGIALPSYEGAVASPEERAEVHALVRGEAEGGPWRHVSDRPGPHVRPFDVLVFHRGQWQSHVGIAVDRSRMLHMWSRSVIDSFTAPRWRARLTGVYRHLEAPVEGGVE